MQRYIPLVAGTTLVLAALVGVGMIAAPPSVADDKDAVECEEIKATIISIADLATFTTQGTIEGDVDGTTMFTGDGLSLTQIVSTTHPPVEPLTFSYTGTLVITTDDGTLTTRGVGVFESGPNGVGTQFDRVIEGTGAFQDATGELYFNFMTDDTGVNLTSDVSGEICTRGNDDEEQEND